MSDRHIVEKNFNELLQTYRAECLPGVTANWQHLTEKEQLEVAKMNNFFCGMHFMVAMADQADKTLKEWEKVQFGAEKVGAAALPENATGPESGTIRLVRTMCKAMEKHGSEQVGCSLPFSEYLKTQGIKKVPLSSFKGNRFNIVFHNAAGVYFLNEHARVFLESIYGTENRLLQAVSADVKVKEYVAATRALGVINKMITVPLWRVIEDKTLGILDMNAKYTSMRDSLKAWSEDASALFTGEVYLFNDTLINRDVVYEKLVEQCTDDSITVEVLQLMFKSFYLTMERMLKDHLPQGVHDKPSAIKISETKSTPKSNVVSERDFAQLDRLLREKPNATTICLEGMILYANNKTRSWLDRKNAEEKSEILKIATKLTPAYKKLFNQRREAIRQHVAQTLKEKQDDIERKKLKAQQQKEKLVNAISADGLWQTADAVEAGMLCYPSVSRQIVALK